MTELEQIGKKLPYAESPVYVDSLVRRCKAGALASAEHKTRLLRPFAYALAACLAAAGVFLGVRLAYVDEFARILNPKQLNRLFDVEKKIQDKLMNRKDRHDGGPGRGRGHKKDRFDD